jgi:hypothetical protein
VLLSGGDNFPHLIKKRSSQLGFVTYLLNYPRNSVLCTFHFVLLTSMVTYSTQCEYTWIGNGKVENNPLAQHVSGIIMPIFRSARPYITAYGSQHLMLLAGVLGVRKACNTLHTVHTDRFPVPQDTSQQHQVLGTICSNIRFSAPEDGHNDARNMLS